jgi:hypothetical protein
VNILKEARGRDCTIRLECCNCNPETTVPCHFRLMGISGMGIKSPDILVAWGCAACHAYVDSHKDPETQLAFAKGVFRTQTILVKEGRVTW